MPCECCAHSTLLLKEIYCPIFLLFIQNKDNITHRYFCILSQIDDCTANDLPFPNCQSALNCSHCISQVKPKRDDASVFITYIHSRTCVISFLKYKCLCRFSKIQIFNRWKFVSFCSRICFSFVRNSQKGACTRTNL